jgi:general secretion pathway protein F
MPTYFYKATDSSGKVVNGSIEAEAEKGVVAELHNMGFIPIRIALSKGNGKRLDVDISKQITSLFKGVSGKDILAFTQDLATLLESGLPVDRALSILIDAAEKEKVKEVVADILKTVQGGGYLSDAMAKHPKAFSRFYVNMVRAGEAGGVLEAVLGRLGSFLESSQDLKDYIKSAMVYPLFLVFVGGISIIILLTFVIPKFSVIFSDMGQAIPFTTRFLLGSARC